MNTNIHIVNKVKEKYITNWNAPENDEAPREGSNIWFHPSDIFVGIAATIPTKIIIDIPLPIPFVVI